MGESQLKEVAESLDLGLVGLSMKGMFTAMLFTVSSNRQAPGGAVSPNQQGLQDVKPSENTEYKKYGSYSSGEEAWGTGKS